MYFVSIHANKMKSVEIVQRRRGEVNITKIDCKHICKYHNLSPCATITIFSKK
jgi:hypothetical protein